MKYASLDSIATIFEQAAKREKKKRSREEKEVYKHYGFGWPGTDKNFVEESLPEEEDEEEYYWED